MAKHNPYKLVKNRWPTLLIIVTFCWLFFQGFHWAKHKCFQHTIASAVIGTDQLSFGYELVRVGRNDQGYVQFLSWNGRLYPIYDGGDDPAGTFKIRRTPDSRKVWVVAGDQVVIASLDMDTGECVGINSGYVNPMDDLWNPNWTYKRGRGDRPSWATVGGGVLVAESGID